MRARRLSLTLYGLAMAILVVATIFFGGAGFILGLVALVAVKVGLWAAPLVKLSYAEPPSKPEPKA